VNWWPSAGCAKAFWTQQDLPPYEQLLTDTLDWAAPSSGERWLDLGCGGGAISRAIWERTNGTVSAVVGLDCAAANDAAYARHRETLTPKPTDALQFMHHDFSQGLGVLGDASFDHAVSGLSISYAECYDTTTNRWTTTAYDRLLGEVFRVIRPGGRFVFSVNVPNPSWGAVAWQSMGRLIRSPHLLRSLKRSMRMMRYGRWLKREALTGRFHYLPAAEVTRKLVEVGFADVQHRMSYCDQAYVFQAHKPR